MTFDKCKSCGGELSRTGNYYVCKFCGNKWMIDADNDVHVIDLIIFLRDPLTAQPHEPDVSALIRLSDVQSISLATNAGSAKIMLECMKNGICFN